ncbi:helix-turn-helix domain-containing protein [Seonamhaeicola algicola]|uniref:Helix-turn-helix domain-containing protein n=1 Tax=Seonamhaeicola algicola TaxID=1719036 RepID=A0A5C7AER2_9FLAO|nr:AraC family transcriptional regulator [Seonamhaeicola algicola]TXE07246.1 helix-turn-helix domain-containing protein [Seonamhaeicola algicola]
MSKAKFLSMGYEPGKALTIMHQNVKYFPNPLHYHKELELAYILEGHGTRYVGSSIKSYKKGDLVLVGEELTHVWVSDDIYYEDNGLYNQAIVVKFYQDFAGKDFLRLPEAKGVLATLKEASGGLKITGQTNKEIGGILKSMLTQSPLEQVLSLIKVLYLMSVTNDKHVLSNYDLHKSTNPKERDRINRVIKHTSLNFRKNISLDEIANVANLSKSAFCRYFKNTVKKTYLEFLYEMRVEYACKLLLDDNLGMTQICYESGFNNPSSFSQIFKRIKGMSPVKYRKTNSFQQQY